MGVLSFVKDVAIGAAIVAGYAGLTVATGGTFLGATTILGAALTGAAVGAGVTALQKAFINKPSMDMSAATDRLNASLNPRAHSKWVFGQTACATDLIYADNDGDYVTQIFEGAGHEIDGFAELYIDDELAITAAGTVTSNWSGILARYTNTGAAGQTALNIPDSFWPSTAVGEGRAHFALHWDLKDGEEVLSGGLPTRITQVVRGAPYYDPRKDVSVGGAGSQRPYDQTSWEYDAPTAGNWALVALQYLIGWHDGVELVWGRGADTDDIDYESFIAMANVCDETLDGKPRYRVHGMFNLTGEHANVFQQLEAATGGRIYKAGGLWRIWVPHDDLVSEGTLTEDDLILDAGIEYQPAGEMADLYNTARGQYISPDDLYQAVDYPEVSEQAAITVDERRRLKEQNFSIVQDVEIAQRVAREMVRRSRFSGTWQFASSPKALLFRPFSVITINNRETNFQDQIVRVTDMKPSLEGAVPLQVLEEHASIYDPTVPLGTPVTQLDPQSFNPRAKIPVSGLTVNDVSYAGPRTTVDALRVSWDDPGGTVRATWVQYRLVGTAQWTQVPTSEIDFTEAIIPIVQPEADYEVRARHVSITGVPGPWTAPTPKTSGNTTNWGVGGSGATIFYQPTPPTANAVDDIWFDSDDGNHAYLWDGSNWVSIQDSEIAQALQDAIQAKDIADGKAKVFASLSTNPPTAEGTGDLWFQTDTEKMFRWDGTAWDQLVSSQDWADIIGNHKPEDDATRNLNPDNIIRNPGAEEGVFAPHVPVDAGGQWVIHSSGLNGTSKSFRYNPGGQSGNARLVLNGGGTNRIPCQAGDKFNMAVQHIRVAAPANRWAIQIRWRKASGSLISASSTTFLSSGSTVLRRVTYTAPAGTEVAEPNIVVFNDGDANALLFDNVVCRQETIEGLVWSDSLGFNAGAQLSNFSFTDTSVDSRVLAAQSVNTSKMDSNNAVNRLSMVPNIAPGTSASYAGPSDLVNDGDNVTLVNLGTFTLDDHSAFANISGEATDESSVSDSDVTLRVRYSISGGASGMLATVSRTVSASGSYVNIGNLEISPVGGLTGSVSFQVVASVSGDSAASARFRNIEASVWTGLNK